MKYHQANNLSFIQVTKQILIKYLLCIKHYARCQGYKGELSLCPWNFLGKDTGVGCHSLLQGIFLTQRLNPGLLQDVTNCN